MTDDTNTKPASQKPSHIAYYSREGRSGKNYWTRIGSAWEHKKGGGFNIQLDGLVPLDGKITLFVPSEKPEAAQE